MRIYVYDNALIEDGDEDWFDALIDQKDLPSDIECLRWFEEKYGSNDFTASFTAP